jgi:hypothetical protein
MIVLGAGHLGRILASYTDYYDGTRTHHSLYKDSPDGRPRQLPGQGRVVERDQVGGLHPSHRLATGNGP